ncbi:hypothetical protein EZV77_25420 [Burkholderia thailandensis]|nr:hypothetical protein A8H32_11320 [Burkholderia thailandensis]MDD1479248.1 hypothetical protein [Burkholderia thailandensis]MDD1485716.1 hypothetical protein [Burkholderia thailandensis]MDD1491119.1 hypothetical protein [Burkholderia thailandensis]PJO73964.1 hypothetical protein CWD92_01155 [Burkholderia thailandensis]
MASVQFRDPLLNGRHAAPIWVFSRGSINLLSFSANLLLPAHFDCPNPLTNFRKRNFVMGIRIKQPDRTRWNHSDKRQKQRIEHG